MKMVIETSRPIARVAKELGINGRVPSFVCAPAEKVSSWALSSRFRVAFYHIVVDYFDTLNPAVAVGMRYRYNLSYRQRREGNGCMMKQGHAPWAYPRRLSP